MADFLNREWLLDVALGRIDGFSGVTLTGTTFSMGTNLMSVWDETDALIDFDLQTSAATVKVSSTDADDTSAGDGARTVAVIGLDAAGNAQSETVTMDGQTEVPTIATWSAIDKCIVLTAGGSGHNEGVIWVGNGLVTTGKPATKYVLVDAALNISHTLVYTVPTAKTACVVAASISSSDIDKGYTIQLCLTPPGGLTIAGNIRGLAGGNDLDLKPLFGPLMSAGTIFTAQAIAKQGSSGNLAVVTEILLIDDA